MIHTFKEQTVKKHTVGEAVSQALLVLKEKSKGRITQVCTDQVKNRDYREQITVKQMSDIVDDLVTDTVYWETGTLFMPRYPDNKSNASLYA